MQGINKSKHVLLLKALTQLGDYAFNNKHHDVCLQQIIDYKNELELMFTDYHTLLVNLEQHIIAYDELYNKVRIQYLSRKLKEIKRSAPSEDTAFAVLITNTLRSYGT